MVFIQDGYLKADQVSGITVGTGSQRAGSKALLLAPLDIAPAEYGLLTDLYQLTMSACYVGESIHQKLASFELFTRRLPAGYGYLIAMGLEQALTYLQNLSFNAQQIAALQRTDIFKSAPDSFWSLLENFRFTGDVWAVPEGTAVFANEPMLRIEAPLWQAQIAETYLLNTLNYQTLIATRAARVRQAAGPNAKIYEFGTRRAFSPQASLWAARAAISGGLDATSNVLAALKLGQKPVGTMAHALVMAISALEGSEDDGFEAFHRYFPGAPLLIDTYDTEAAAQRLAQKLAKGLAVDQTVTDQTVTDQMATSHESDTPLAGVRIDSGDLVKVSQAVRSHLPNTPIFASGDLDEFAIAQLCAQNACIDGYGLGTKLVTGAPVNGVYKLVDIDSKPVMKESSGKLTYPGRKQIFRQYKKDHNQNNLIVGDRLALAIESAVGSAVEGASSAAAQRSNVQSGTTQNEGIQERVIQEVPLLQRVMVKGERLLAPEGLEAIAQRTAESVNALPLSVRRLENPEPLTVTLSHELETLTQRTRQTTKACASNLT